jgi:hypothetical protein
MGLLASTPGIVSILKKEHKFRNSIDSTSLTRGRNLRVGFEVTFCDLKRLKLTVLQYITFPRAVSCLTIYLLRS